MDKDNYMFADDYTATRSPRPDGLPVTAPIMVDPDEDPVNMVEGSGMSLTIIKNKADKVEPAGIVAISVGVSPAATGLFFYLSPDEMRSMAEKLQVSAADLERMRAEFHAANTTIN